MIEQLVSVVGPEGLVEDRAKFGMEAWRPRSGAQTERHSSNSEALGVDVE
jgi:hypothetical protein